MKTILGIIWGAVDIVRRLLGMAERQQEREIGAALQREANEKETINAQREQLDVAANARPGRARKRLRDKSF